MPHELSGWTLSESQSGPPTYWFDVEDLFEHAAIHSRPSGIQRVVAEILSELHALPETTSRIRCVRHDRRRGGLRVVPWPEVARLFPSVAVAASPTPSRMAPAGDILKPRLRRPLSRLPPMLRRRLLTTTQLQAQAWRARSLPIPALSLKTTTGPVDQET